MSSRCPEATRLAIEARARGVSLCDRVATCAMPHTARAILMKRIIALPRRTLHQFIREKSSIRDAGWPFSIIVGPRRPGTQTRAIVIGKRNVAQWGTR